MVRYTFPLFTIEWLVDTPPARKVSTRLLAAEMPRATVLIFG